MNNTTQHTSAIYALNSYTFKLLEANLDWNVSDYANRRPIIPAAQQPEFKDVGHDFIVYTSAINPAVELWPIQSETVAYTIYSKSTTSADRVVDLLVKAFQRQDESAADVNEWLSRERAGGGSNKRLVGFTSIQSTLGEKSNPADQEDGLYNAVVMISLNYVTLDDPEVPPLILNGFTYP